MAETPPRSGRFARAINRRVARAITAHNKALFPNAKGPRIISRPSWDTKDSGYSMYNPPEFYTDEELAVIASQRPYWPNEPAATAWSRHKQDLRLQLRYRDHRRYPPLSRPYNAEELHLVLDPFRWTVELRCVSHLAFERGRARPPADECRRRRMHVCESRHPSPLQMLPVH